MTDKKIPFNQITMENVRLSYCDNLFKAGSFSNEEEKDSDPKFSASFILDKIKHSTTITEMDKIIDKVAMDAWKKKVVLKHRGLRDGLEKEDKDGYGDHVMFLNAKSWQRPSVVTLKDPGVPIMPDDNVIYAGCYVNACVSFKAYSHPKGGKGVKVNLLAVQFLRDGEPFGEHVDPEDVFEGQEEDNPLG